MIGRVHQRGCDLSGLLWYLYGPGREAEHDNQRLVGGWRHPWRLEPPAGPDGQRDFRHLVGAMEAPLTMLGDRAPAHHVWHCSVRAGPGDPVLGDGAWMAIAQRVMHRAGLSDPVAPGEGVPWVAVHHGDNHVHLVAVLGRLDGKPAQLHNDYYRVGEALAEIEAEYGLQPGSSPDRTAARRPTRAEAEKARAAGRAEPPRTTLLRQAGAAAAAARSEAEFLAGLERRGVRVKVRAGDDGQPGGYAVALPGDTGAGGRAVWFGGGKLAPDLTLPKLRRRWPGDAARPPSARSPGRGASAAGGPPGRAGRERLSGGRMNGGAARAALRGEVRRAAEGARSEAEFWAGLAAAGVLARPREVPGRPGTVSGYAVSLPALTHYRDGQQVWYGGATLDQRLSLTVLRRRWQAGLTGAPPGPDEVFGDADLQEIYAYAATVAADAARQIRASRGDQAADVAWAASDLITAAAEATRNPELQRAADGFARAGRCIWGRIPPPSPGGLMLRTAAWLLARCRPGGSPVRAARAALTSALALLGRALAGMRARQNRVLQAGAARQAAGRLAAAAPPAWPAPPAARATGGPSHRPGGPPARRRPRPPGSAPRLF